MILRIEVYHIVNRDTPAEVVDLAYPAMSVKEIVDKMFIQYGSTAKIVLTLQD